MSSQDKMLALLDAFSVESPVWSADDLAAKFTITADDGTAWIRLPETIMKTTATMAA